MQIERKRTLSRVDIVVWSSECHVPLFLDLLMMGLLLCLEFWFIQRPQKT